MPSLILACLWVISASLIAMLPSKRHHWPAAYVLATVGIPLLGWVTYQNGPVLGLVCLFAGASILRWPLRRLVGRLAPSRPRPPAEPST